MSSRAGVVLSLWVAAPIGCGGSTLPQPQTAERSTPTPEGSVDEPFPITPPLASASPVPSASVSAPATEPVPAAAVCEAKCDKLVVKCSASAVDTCRLNCTRYDPPTPGCESQTQSAFSCARDAKELTCANVAPDSCASKFRDLADCSAGIAAPKQTEEPAALPPGWERVHDRARGFSIAMPRGSTEAELASQPARVVTLPTGTTYSMRILPPLKEKPNEKVLLHLLMDVQGRCSDKLKVDGFVEKASGSLIHFSSRCPDDTDSNGMVYVGANATVVLGAQAKAGEMAVTEPFFYGLEYDNP